MGLMLSDKTISIADFKKLEIKIGKVISVEKVIGADKLLKFIIDLGSEQRQILSGIAQFYPNPEMLIGKEIPILVNLEPRIIRGQKSEGMILLADDSSQPVLLCPEQTVLAGTIVR
jgi:methionine--tRNA ligase beta chain